MTASIHHLTLVRNNKKPNTVAIPRRELLDRLETLNRAVVEIKSLNSLLYDAHIKSPEAQKKIDLDGKMVRKSMVFEYISMFSSKSIEEVDGLLLPILRSVRAKVG